MNQKEMKELLYQALETEQGGVQVYETALRCVVNEELKKEWQEYLEQTQNHVRIVEGVFTQLGLDTKTETPGRMVVRHIGQSLVKAMEMALDAGKPEAAQLVAAECIVQAETKDHLNWELIGELAKKLKGDEGRRRSERRTKRSRRRRTSISTTRPAGPGSCGSRRSGCPPFSRPPRKKRRSRPPSARRGPRRRGRTCCRTSARDPWPWHRASALSREHSSSVVIRARPPT